MHVISSLTKSSSRYEARAELHRPILSLNCTLRDGVLQMFKKKKKSHPKCDPVVKYVWKKQMQTNNLLIDFSGIFIY